MYVTERGWRELFGAKDRDLLLKLAYEAQAEALARLDDLPVCSGGHEVRPAYGVEKCPDCGRPAPVPCLFCGRFTVPRRAGLVKWCGEACKELAAEWAQEDRPGLPPAYEIVVKQPTLPAGFVSPNGRSPRHREFALRMLAVEKERTSHWPLSDEEHEQLEDRRRELFDRYRMGKNTGRLAEQGVEPGASTSASPERPRHPSRN